MDGVMHTTLLTSAFFLSSLLPQASTSAALSPLPTIGQESFHVVKENETLSDVAKIEYNDEKKVSVLLTDNEWVANPDHIEAGWQIKIRKNPLLRSTQPDGVATESPTPTPPTASLPLVQAESVIATPTLTSIDTNTQQTVTPQAPLTSPSSLTEEQITFLGMCESGMTATRNSGNGFYGAFQFSSGTWNNMGTGYARADLAPLEVQKDAVQRLLQRSSIWTQFPGCSAKMRASGLI
jgi:hypothetical protein